MTLSSSQQAALRAKKAIANGNTSFKPRGEKNKAAFDVLKEQETRQNISASNSVSAESPPHNRMKITAAPSHTSDPARLLDSNPLNISDTSEQEEEQQDDAMLAKIKAHKEFIKKKEEHMTNELSKQQHPAGPWYANIQTCT